MSVIRSVGLTVGSRVRPACITGLPSMSPIGVNNRSSDVLYMRDSVDDVEGTGPLSVLTAGVPYKVADCVEDSAPASMSSSSAVASWSVPGSILNLSEAWGVGLQRSAE